jgi:hypothetical protein
MMPGAERFPFTASRPTGGPAALLPYLPLTLTFRQSPVQVMGLADTGATVNVLPFSVGRQLGAVWEEQTIVVPLTGNLAAHEARALVVVAAVGRFPPVRLAFAWTESDNVPVLLGQVNFFTEFDFWMSRSRQIFEVNPK